MITSVQPWKTKEELQVVARKNPNLVCVSGTLFDSEKNTSHFSAALDRIPYRHHVVTKHKGDFYKFGVATDGRITVE